MSALVARIVLATMIVPLAVVLSLAPLVLVGGGRPPTTMHIVAIWLFNDLVCGAYWILLWRRVVCWTRERVALTVASVPAALLLGALLAVLIRVMPLRPPAELSVFAAGALSAMAWVITTVIIWRETPAERARRLARAGTDSVCCPVCGYNLTGMRELRCPECGARFTADELLRAQPQRERGALVDQD